MFIIVLVTIAVFFVSLVWLWHCLGDIDRSKKIIFILIGLIFIFLITFIVFQISSKGIFYEKEETKKIIQNTLVPVFASVNTLILLPYMAKQLNKLKLKEIKKDKFKNRILFIIFIFLICLILESGYLRDIQYGILKIYQAYSDVM